ncbi:MAG: adenine phosphoribosyltransferase [Bradymonadales bacterium]|nr:MAG: adenine phosphoribosyltransferase [Bradymonadales bacterium]
MNRSRLESLIREVADFPRPGIQFKDITPVLQDPEGFQFLVAEMSDQLKSFGKIEKLVAVESRGFILASALAVRNHLSLALVRKPGKLPWKHITESYELEYGQGELSMHVDAVRENEKLVIVDDLLATGGTLEASAKLCEKLGGEVIGLQVFIELSALGGRERLGAYSLSSLFKI